MLRKSPRRLRVRNSRVEVARGKKFGRLLVVRLEGIKKRRRLWRCRCECGRQKLVPTQMLTRKKTQSCGCLRIDELKKRVSHLKRSLRPELASAS